MNAATTASLLPDPAHRLVGRELTDGWRVVEQVQRLPTDTGGNFSVSYVVEGTDGRRAFLKALDYSSALRLPNVAEVLKAMTEGYLFERDTLDECERRRMSRIVRVYGSGTVVDPSFAHSVDYLIFEPAEGDVRRALDAMMDFDIAWALSTCHDAAVAVQQLHAARLAHQDLKPSNLLVFGENVAKLADLGRSSRRGIAAPHDNLAVRGDLAYAPPELLYGQIDLEWSVRCQACDIYLLGSIILFVFARTQTTAEIFRRLPAALRPHPFGTFAGNYANALPYVIDAFDEVVHDFAAQLEGLRSDELARHFSSLCHPDPAQRGDALHRRRGQNPFDLRRVISRLDVLRREARGGYLRRRSP
jgi:eukaryotic-like serine/threonine-protein kinase